MQKISQSQYLNHPNHCPVCGGELNCDSMQTDNNVAWQDIWCMDCGASWTDQYKLVGMSDPCNIDNDTQYEIVD